MGLYSQTIETSIGSMLVCSDEHSICLLEFLDSRYLARHLELLEMEFSTPIVESLTEPMRQLISELDDYLAGKLFCFTISIRLPKATPFQQKVWNGLQDVPLGQTVSYSDFSRRIGLPRSCRAVATAVGQNRLMIIIPCHRIVGIDGSLVGFAGGINRKKHLIQIEKSHYSCCG